MKKFAPFFLGVLFLAGCGTAPDVTSYVNPISNRRTDILANDLLDIPYSDRELIWLNAFRDFTSEFKYKYYLEVIYGAREDVGYLEITPGRSLTITADGDELKFTGLGALKKWTDKGVVYESARYEATSYDMNKIANASKVSLKIAGKNGLVARQFAPANSERFQKFMAQSGGSGM